MRSLPQCSLLEPRRLFAAAPPTLLTLEMTLKITSGKAPFDSSGTYVATFADTGRTYQLVTPLDTTSGSWSYSLSAPDTAKLTLTGTELGTVNVTVKFTAATAGTYSATSTAGGSQTGTFSIAGKSFATISDETVNVVGTADGDAVSISLSSGKINITRNNITQKFTASEVDAILLSTGAGNDVVDATTFTRPFYIDAGLGNDKITGSLANDTLTGAAGKDTIYGNAGDDRLNGGSSADAIYGQDGADRLYGGDGNDMLDGGGGVDRLFGEAGADQLFGGSSNDKLYGGADNDSLFGGKGADLMDGGAGTDSGTSDGTDTLVSVP